MRHKKSNNKQERVPIKILPYYDPNFKIGKIKLDNPVVWTKVLVSAFDQDTNLETRKSKPRLKNRRNGSVVRNVKSSVAAFEDCPVEEDLER